MTTVLITVAIALAVIAATAHGAPSAPVVPEEVAVSDGSKPFLIAHAIGLQIYTARTPS